MDSRWFSGVSSKDLDEKARRSQIIRNSSLVLQILTELLRTKIKSHTTTDSDDFDNPNWPFKRAYQDGCLKAYNDILQMVEIQGDQS